jgi:hypothetical protein
LSVCLHIRSNPYRKQAPPPTAISSEDPKAEEILTYTQSCPHPKALIPMDTHGQKKHVPHQDITIIAGQVPQVLGKLLLKLLQLL